jgi:hypothetical protein
MMIVFVLGEGVPIYRSGKEFVRGDWTGVLMIREQLPANTSSTPAGTCCRGRESGI